jgi:hypothetical protein
VTSWRLALACLAVAGCAADGEGTLSFRISGEDGALVGIPNDEAAFADGWSVEFDRYLVAVADLHIAADGGGTGARDDRVYVADLHAGEPDFEELGPLAARRWDRVSWEMRAPTDDDDVVALDGVSAEDVAKLRDGGFVYWIEGRATNDDREVTFAWGLDNASVNRDCTNGFDGTAGLVVRNNTISEAEITIHVEHMFWDTLGSEQNELRFEPIASVADADGVVSWAALAEQELANLRDVDGEPLADEMGVALVYNPGSLPLANLQEFILAATRTQAHFGGEGLCSIEPL